MATSLAVAAPRVPGATPRRQASTREQRLVALLPLVQQVASQIRRRLPAQVEWDDLVGAGTLGLIDAVDKFDAGKRVKLECYAWHRVRGAILDGLRSLDHTSRGCRRTSRRVERIRGDLEARQGGPVGDEQMAAALGISLPRWFQVQQELHRQGADGTSWREATRAAPENAADSEARFESPFDLCYRREQRDVLSLALAHLPERQRLIVALYDLQGMTMKQIAVRLRVDESRVSQLHAAALSHLRESVQALVRLPCWKAEECQALRAGSAA
jgi:RNA polymerase sigma factor for flagellar operon FliA